MTSTAIAIASPVTASKARQSKRELLGMSLSDSNGNTLAYKSKIKSTLELNLLIIVYPKELR